MLQKAGEIQKQTW